MKKTFSLLVTIILMLAISASQAQYVPTPGPGGGSTTVSECNSNNPPCYCTDSCTGIGGEAGDNVIVDICDTENPPIGCEAACGAEPGICTSGIAGGVLDPLYPNNSFRWSCSATLSNRTISCSKKVSNLCSSQSLVSQPTDFSALCSTGGFVSTGTIVENLNGVESYFFAGSCPDTPVSDSCRFPLENLVKISSENGLDSQEITEGESAQFLVRITNIYSEPLSNIRLSDDAQTGCTISPLDSQRFELTNVIQKLGLLNPGETLSFVCRADNVTLTRFVSQKNTLRLRATGTISGEEKTAMDITQVSTLANTAPVTEGAKNNNDPVTDPEDEIIKTTVNPPVLVPDTTPDPEVSVPGTTPLYTIRGRLYFDENKNGIIDTDESVSGSSISLTDKAGTITRYATSDIQGDFAVSDLANGEYILSIGDVDGVYFSLSTPISLQGGDYRGTFAGFRLEEIKKVPEIVKIFELPPDDLPPPVEIIDDGFNSAPEDPEVFINPGIPDPPIKKVDTPIIPVLPKIGEVTPNTFVSYIEKGYSLEEQKYSPAPLALINDVPASFVCGDAVVNSGEVCDDGDKNGQYGYCSTTCLYRDVSAPAKFSSLVSAVLYPEIAVGEEVGIIRSFAQSISETSVFQQVASSRVIEITAQAIDDVVGIENIESVAQVTNEIIDAVGTAAEEIITVAQYSVLGVTALLTAAVAASNILVFKARWTQYVVQAGDTLESIGDKFTMTTRAIKKQNNLLKKTPLNPGTKISVRNRHFLEKDYLDQLQYVLKDFLESRHLGKMGHHRESAINKIVDKTFDFVRNDIVNRVKPLTHIFRKFI